MVRGRGDGCERGGMRLGMSGDDSHQLGGGYPETPLTPSSMIFFYLVCISTRNAYRV